MRVVILELLFILYCLVFLNTSVAFKKKRPDLGPPIYEENEVQILTDSDWDENLLNYDVYLILFYMSDCNITKSFMKHFESAAEFLIITQPYTPLAKVECSPENKKTSGICSKISSKKLPIMRYLNCRAQLQFNVRSRSIGILYFHLITLIFSPKSYWLWVVPPQLLPLRLYCQLLGLGYISISISIPKSQMLDNFWQFLTIFNSS